MTEKPEYFLIEKHEIEMLDTIGAIPHNALIGVLKGRPLVEHDAAIAQAAREDEREKVLDELQKYVVSNEITLPSDQSEDSNEFVYSGELQQKIESLRSTTPAKKPSCGIKNIVDQSFEEYKRDIAPCNRMKQKKDGA